MTEDYELAVSDREALRIMTVFASSIDEDDANGKEKDNA